MPRQIQNFRWGCPECQSRVPIGSSVVATPLRTLERVQSGGAIPGRASHPAEQSAPRSTGEHFRHCAADGAIAPQSRVRAGRTAPHRGRVLVQVPATPPPIPFCGAPSNRTIKYRARGHGRHGARARGSFGVRSRYEVPAAIGQSIAARARHRRRNDAGKSRLTARVRRTQIRLAGRAVDGTVRRNDPAHCPSNRRIRSTPGFCERFAGPRLLEQ